MSARTPSSNRPCARLGPDEAPAASPTKAISAKPAMAPLLARRPSRGSAIRINPQTAPAAPSASVIARVPISGMRKNVVPSVPMIEPAVETP